MQSLTNTICKHLRALIAAAPDTRGRRHRCRTSDPPSRRGVVATGIAASAMWCRFSSTPSYKHCLLRLLFITILYFLFPFSNTPWPAFADHAQPTHSPHTARAAPHVQPAKRPRSPRSARVQPAFSPRSARVQPAFSQRSASMHPACSPPVSRDPSGSSISKP